MKSTKRYLWGLSLLVVALFALSSLSRPAPQGAIAEQSQSNAPEALEESAKDPPPLALAHMFLRGLSRSSTLLAVPSSVCAATRVSAR